MNFSSSHQPWTPCGRPIKASEVGNFDAEEPREISVPVMTYFFSSAVAFVPGLPQFNRRLGHMGRGKFNGLAGCATGAFNAARRPFLATTVSPGPGGTSPRPRPTPAAGSRPTTSPTRCRAPRNGSSASSAARCEPRILGSAGAASCAPGTVPAPTRPSATRLLNAATPAPGPGGAGGATR